MDFFHWTYIGNTALAVFGALFVFECYRQICDALYDWRHRNDDCKYTCCCKDEKADG